MNGLANIRTNGLLLGMSQSEVDERRDAIVQFSELGAFIHEPLRTYSSGMVMRLAFSIAIHANPEIFLVDEALSVGDGHFQQKCMHRIREFRSQGGAIIFVSHDLNAIKMLCDRVIVLSGGSVVADGEPEQAVNEYNKLLAAQSESSLLPPAEGGYGDFKAVIEDAEIYGVDSQSSAVSCGEVAVVKVAIEAKEHLPALTLGMMIRDRFGQDIYGTNSHLLRHPFGLKQGESRLVQFRFPMRLAPGKYTITLALHEGLDHSRHCYHWWDNAISFEVSGIRGSPFGGLCNLDAVFEQGGA
jgi:lipopolysaccharide transport system ATP-binding protein